MNEKIDTVIIGGGHAGLTMSYFLSQRGPEHLILERGRVAERWISERWDSFYFQFPNWTIELGSAASRSSAGSALPRSAACPSSPRSRRCCWRDGRPSAGCARPR